VTTQCVHCARRIPTVGRGAYHEGPEGSLLRCHDYPRDHGHCHDETIVRWAVAVVALTLSVLGVVAIRGCLREPREPQGVETLSPEVYRSLRP
jgi:hypothetical protein